MSIITLDLLGTLTSKPTGYEWVGSPRQLDDEEDSVVPVIEWNDDCGNGHKSFSITRQGYGRDHDTLARAFPELAFALRWHGMTEEGPLYYLENTIHHAGDRDCWGLRKGEKKYIVNGRTGQPVWHLEAEDGTPLRQIRNQKEGPEPPPPMEVVWRPWCLVGEGKQRDLDAARRTAIWPEATDEELCQEPKQLRRALEDRLPALMRDFYRDLTRLGIPTTAKEL